MAPNRTPPLDEEIEAVRAKIESYIDARVAEARKIYTDLPDSVVRRGLTKGIGCQCAAYLEIKKDDEANAKSQKGAA